ncbi:hypothetical protein SVAN01_09124 [Stagonosporopsis vannaccii]|nr:hypothetical protein SVAN01_09124 [Stagonosporopsis vannaccii]
MKASLQILDTVLSTPSAHPSQTSSQSVFLSLEDSPFRYYLPHISTSATRIYTKDSVFACNLSLSQHRMSIASVPEFFRYLPHESTEVEGMYTDQHEAIVVTTPVVPTAARKQPRPEVRGPWNKGLAADPLTHEECGGRWRWGFGELHGWRGMWVERRGAQGDGEAGVRAIYESEVGAEDEEDVAGAASGWTQEVDVSSQSVSTHNHQNFKRIFAGHEMHCFLKKLDMRADSYLYSPINKRFNGLPTNFVGRTSARPRAVYQSAACRGLYAAPQRPRIEHAQSDDQDDSDPIITCSIYPQINGKRRSELEAQLRTRSTKYDRASYKAQHNKDIGEVDRQACRQRPLSRVRSLSVESNAFDVSIKVPMKPQQASAVFSNGSSCEGQVARGSSSHTSRCSSLPGDEYRILVRRQKMQRAREVLELHYAHHGSVRGVHIEHGMMQSFTMRNSERRRLSKTQYAVRKALQADLNLNNDDFKLAMDRHADRVYFCELSDVDGLPIDESIMNDFISLYQKARNTAIEANLLGRSRTDTVQRPWLRERNHRVRQATLAIQRLDSAVEMDVSLRRPQLVSKFSWDSNKGEVERQRLTKIKR